MKKLRTLVCFIVMTLFYGVTSLSAAQNLPSEQSPGSKLTTGEGMILLAMENLVMINETWGRLTAGTMRSGKLSRMARRVFTFRIRITGLSSKTAN